MGLTTELSLFTKDQDEIQQIVYHLSGWGCCPRCILRFLGQKYHPPYKEDIQVLRCWIKEKAAAHQSKLDREGGEPEESILHNSEDGDGSDEGTVISSCTCIVCLGLLQEYYCTKVFIDHISENVKIAGYQYTHFICALNIPVSTLIREHAVWTLLEEKLPSIYKPLLQSTDLPAMKDVWKFVNARQLETSLDAQMRSLSPFEVSIFFSNSDVEKECTFLLDLFPSIFVQRKKTTVNEKWQTFNNTNVSQALDQLTVQELKKNFQCPPRRLQADTVVERIECNHGPIYVAGRYNKYSRSLSQTPWMVDGKRKSELSVEEIIANPIKEKVLFTECRFSSSGREDVDVKMLGNGRPFVLELMEPHRVFLSPDDLHTLQKEINNSSADVQVRDLQIVAREDTTILKSGELEKKKTYSALCWCKKPLTQQKLDVAVTAKIADFTVKQKTPIRVLHRRSLASRDKIIHKACATLVDDHHFKLDLTTQAGTYIKEFVHGDFGRTSPNVCDLLDAECDILELDVTEVDLDWPKRIDYG